MCTGCQRSIVAPFPSTAATATKSRGILRAEVVAVYGASRRRVRVVRKMGGAGPLLVVEWYERRTRKVKSGPDTRANLAVAKTWARTFSEARLLPRKVGGAKLGLRDLWELYTSACFPALRLRTQTLYRDDWRKWELFAGAATPAEDVTSQMLHGFRRALERQGLGVNGLRQVVKTCKVVYSATSAVPRSARAPAHAGGRPRRRDRQTRSWPSARSTTRMRGWRTATSRIATTVERGPSPRPTGQTPAGGGS